jgi:hypothetical protein
MQCWLVAMGSLPPDVRAALWEIQEACPRAADIVLRHVLAVTYADLRGKANRATRRTEQSAERFERHIELLVLADLDQGKFDTLCEQDIKVGDSRFAQLKRDLRKYLKLLAQADGNRAEFDRRCVEAGVKKIGARLFDVLKEHHGRRRAA